MPLTHISVKTKATPHIAHHQPIDRPTDQPTGQQKKSCGKRQWLLARCKLPINEANNDGLYFSNVFWFLSTFFVLSSSSSTFVFVVAHRTSCARINKKHFCAVLTLINSLYRLSLFDMNKNYPLDFFLPLGFCSLLLSKR